MKYLRQFFAWVDWITRGRALMNRRIDELTEQRMDRELASLRAEMDKLRDILLSMKREETEKRQATASVPRNPADFRRFLAREEENAVA